MKDDIRARLTRLASAAPKWRGQIATMILESKESYPWDECIKDQMAHYGNKETAEKVCGAIKAKSQGLGKHS